MLVARREGFFGITKSVAQIIPSLIDTLLFSRGEGFGGKNKLAPACTLSRLTQNKIFHLHPREEQKAKIDESKEQSIMQDKETR
jgi:hypothetical protein